MATDTSAATKFFPKAQDGFTTTTSGSVSSGGTSVGLSSTGNYTNGDTVVFIIEPGVDGKEQSFTGVMDVGGSQVTGVVWTSGTNSAHSGGVTIVDYITAAHLNLVSSGILQEHNPAGTHGAITATSLNATGAVSTDTLSEHTAATGVTVDGLNIKDSKLNTASSVVNSNITAGAVTYDKAAAGFCVQLALATNTGVGTTTTTIPYDDTIPQITEGTEFMTVSITPKTTTNILIVEVTAVLARSAAGNMTMALFRDAGADAVAAVPVRIESVDGAEVARISYGVVAGSVAATTFRMRAGPTSGTLTFNGANAARLYGAIVKSSMVVTEFNA